MAVPTLDFFSDYMLMAAVKKITPKKTFFRDRYFPTEEEDIFDADKVLIEYQDGDEKLAPFVSDRVGDIPVDRMGYRVSEYTPAKIAPSRLLTSDDLKKRGFGEALYAGDDASTRAAKLQKKDMSDLDARIARREEWMCAETMVNNACTMQSYIDANTEGDKLYVRFYEQTSDHTYTVGSGAKWGTSGGDAVGDIANMCRMLAENGLPYADLVLGSKAYAGLLADAKLAKMLDRTTAFNDSVIAAQISEYAGVTYIGTLNFDGYRLNVIVADETYKADDGTTQKFFPTKGAMVTAPKCGHMMYAHVVQMPYGSSEFVSVAAKRVPKLIVDNGNDIRKMRLTARPLAAPKAYCPWIYAADVVA